MSQLRDTLERDLYRGRRTKAFPLRLFALLIAGRGQRGCIAWLRFAQALQRRGLTRLARWAGGEMERRFACYIHINAQIGPGLKLPHPVGVVIGEGVAIGSRCTIYQNVTLGGARQGDWQAGNYPVIGDDVVFFAGAAILGAVRVGDDVTVGANAVVLDSIPPASVAVGAPARAKAKHAPRQKAVGA